MALLLDLPLNGAASTQASANEAPSIEGLQYLRGIAALMVVFHHAKWYFPPDSILSTAAWAEFGSRGVDVFFVISGFVMAHSTQGYDPSRLRIPQAVDFFVKRLIRVVPLYWMATSVVVYKAIPKDRGTINILRDFFFVPHFNDHGLIWPILFQGWTINYEMFFYALFTLSLLVGRRRFLVLTVALLALTTLGVAASFINSNTGSAAQLFYTSNLLVEFVMGIWLRLGMSRFPLHLSRPALASITALSFGLLAIPISDQARGFADGILASLIVWSSVLWAVRTDWRWLRVLGDASYSIYLFHLMCFGFASRLFWDLNLIAPTPVNMCLVITLYLAIASTLGVAVHFCIEKPMLNGLRSLLKGSLEGNAGAVRPAR